MRRVLILLLAPAALLAFPASALALGCIDNGFTKTISLPAGTTHRKFAVDVPLAGTVRVELSFRRSTVPRPEFLVDLRGSTWTAPATMLDTRYARACRVAAGNIHCEGARPQTAVGHYRLNVRKLSAAPAAVTVDTCWPSLEVISGSSTHTFTLAAGETHRRFPISLFELGTVTVKLRYLLAPNRNAVFLVHLRRARWPGPLTLLDTRDTHACRIGFDRRLCAGWRRKTSAGSYVISVRKLSQAPARITLVDTYP